MNGYTAVQSRDSCRISIIVYPLITHLVHKYLFANSNQPQLKIVSFDQKFNHLSLSQHMLFQRFVVEARSRCNLCEQQQNSHVLFWTTTKISFTFPAKRYMLCKILVHLEQRYCVVGDFSDKV